ncbi:MAG: GNAT family N-acetyltransferase [Candidatus Omnitrophota bacterium]
MLELIKLKKENLNRLEPFFYLREDGFLFPNKKITEQKRRHYILSELKKEDKILAVTEKEKIVGCASLKKATWDSQHFGLDMGSLSIKVFDKSSSRKQQAVDKLLKGMLEISAKKNIKHLAVKVNPFQIEEIQGLERNGFYYTATLISFIIDLEKYNFALEDEKALLISSFEKEDLSRLKKIAFDSFRDKNIWTDRFHADPYLDKKKADKLYEKWLVNCCSGQAADKVFVARIKQQPVGFISAKYDKDLEKKTGIKITTVPLNAVDEKYRGRGIYRALVCELLSILKNENKDYAMITTQLTTKAIAKVWMGLGAKVDSSKIVFHKV